MELEQTTQTQELTELVTEEGRFGISKSKTVRTIHGNLGSRTQSELSSVPTRSLCSFYTIQVPDDLLSYEPKIQPAGNNPIWLNWSETGSVIVWWQYTLTVTQVAQKHVYLFTLVNGEAKVYVSKEQPVEEQPYLF